MPPKLNAKAAAGRARKAEQADKKAAEANAKAEAQEAASWEEGAKGKSAADKRAEKAAEAARKKAEKDRLLAEEEANTPSAKPSQAKKAAAGGAGGKKGGGAAGGAAPKKQDKAPADGGLDDAVSSFAASNIDDALDAMTLATEKTDKATVGTKAAEIERHPERRFKAAFEAFKEREMPRVREERPGLRKQQYEEVLYKEFQKHPDNPFNQVTVAYDATKEEKVATLQAQRESQAKRLASK